MKIKSNEEKPQVTFINSIMYDINTKFVDKILTSKETYRYENKDQLKDAIVVLRNANNNSDTISAKYIKRENEIYDFQKDVVISRDKDFRLTTDSLQYDMKSGVASNSVPFLFRYKNSIFSGTNLSLSRNNYAISGDSAHFRINTKDL
ncbi:MAG: LPS export ABC transporter periplasmic protein LptC [Arcobacteraceae bacterium]|nr:LPS export ABC transporter periplasmic protein LptC [Arcobacteraceae bacterium]